MIETFVLLMTSWSLRGRNREKKLPLFYLNNKNYILFLTANLSSPTPEMSLIEASDIY